MASILGIGIAAADIINITDGFPKEDDEVRAVKQIIRRGGNVTNTLAILSQLGHQCQWLGTLADDNNSQIIIDDLKQNSIEFPYCQRIANSKTPTSYITLNQQNGSRTIVHYRDLPELSASAIYNIDINNLDWVHFEGRNVHETQRMMDYVRQQSATISISVEIEKPRKQLELLFSGADTYFFSRALAKAQQFPSAETLLRHYRNMIPDALLVCTWAEQGAYALRQEQLLHAAATPVSKIIDTIGAGDTFNAGFIHSQIQGQNDSQSLAFACRLAARKCGMDGFSGVANGTI
jgi:ketohexokinase